MIVSNAFRRAFMNAQRANTKAQAANRFAQGFNTSPMMAMQMRSLSSGNRIG